MFKTLITINHPYNLSYNLILVTYYLLFEQRISQIERIFLK